MRHLAQIVFLLALAAALRLNAAAALSSSCRECHQNEFSEWAGSHHGLAERAVSLALDGKAFEPPRVLKAGTVTNEIRLTNNQCQIVTLGFNTNVAAFTAARAIGVDPIRQYLTAGPNGRWQTLEVSYDTRSNDWFDVYGDEDRRTGEWGHWTGRGMNWNSMCAQCHNTNLRKNYDPATDSYHTAMDEISVSCGSCHSGMAEHNAWQASHRSSKEKDPTLHPPAPVRMMGTCGSCHSRREELTGNFSPGDSYFDHFQMQTAGESDDWFADGQVHSEDYEFASFMGSKMHERGVTCMDCHNPHSGKTLLAGNDLCMRCHSGAFTNAPVINPTEHSHHLAASAGNLCVSCHMPVTVYMQRHARHDHGMTIPDPLLTKGLNIPNACNRCHTDKSAEWAITSTDAWHTNKMNRPTRDRARVIAAAQAADKSAGASLVALLDSGHESSYWRAAEANLLWQFSDDADARSALIRALRDEHPLVRALAVKSLEPHSSERTNEIYAAIKPLLSDPIQSVRIAAAWVLRTSLDTNSAAGRDLLAMLAFNSDQPVGQYRAAMFELDRNDPARALGHLQKAELWDPFSPPLRLEMADVLSQLGKTNDAIRELREFHRLDPNAPPPRDLLKRLGLQ